MNTHTQIILNHYDDNFQSTPVKDCNVSLRTNGDIYLRGSLICDQNFCSQEIERKNQPKNSKPNFIKIITEKKTYDVVEEFDRMYEKIQNLEESMNIIIKKLTMLEYHPAIMGPIIAQRCQDRLDGKDVSFDVNFAEYI